MMKMTMAGKQCAVVLTEESVNDANCVYGEECVPSTYNISITIITVAIIIRLCGQISQCTMATFF